MREYGRDSALSPCAGAVQQGLLGNYGNFLLVGQLECQRKPGQSAAYDESIESQHATCPIGLSIRRTIANLWGIDVCGVNLIPPGRSMRLKWAILTFVLVTGYTTKPLDVMSASDQKTGKRNG